jgi:hypothetical protein
MHSGLTLPTGSYVEGCEIGRNVKLLLTLQPKNLDTIFNPPWQS